MNVAIKEHANRDGSHIQFYDKVQLMLCAKDLIARSIFRPDSMRGIKLPKGMEIQDRQISHFDFLVKYYGREVGIVDLHALGITYLI